MATRHMPHAVLQRIGLMKEVIFLYLTVAKRQYMRELTREYEKIKKRSRGFVFLDCLSKGTIALDIAYEMASCCYNQLLHRPPGRYKVLQFKLQTKAKDKERISNRGPCDCFSSVLPARKAADYSTNLMTQITRLFEQNKQKQSTVERAKFSIEN